LFYCSQLIVLTNIIRLCSLKFFSKKLLHEENFENDLEFLEIFLFLYLWYNFSSSRVEYQMQVIFDSNILVFLMLRVMYEKTVL